MGPVSWGVFFFESTVFFFNKLPCTGSPAGSSWRNRAGSTSGPCHSCAPLCHTPSTFPESSRIGRERPSRVEQRGGDGAKAGVGFRYAICLPFAGAEPDRRRLLCCATALSMSMSSSSVIRAPGSTVRDTHVYAPDARQSKTIRPDNGHKKEERKNSAPPAHRFPSPPHDACHSYTAPQVCTYFHTRTLRPSCCRLRLSKP